MNFRDFRRVMMSACPNCYCIFLFLAIFVLLSTLFNMDMVKKTQLQVEFQNKWNHTKDKNHKFCNFQPLSPKAASEASLLLESIAWPETPTLPSPLFLNQTSDPAHSTVIILPGRTGGQWYTGDQLEVMIKMYDFLGHPKKTGGDLLFARLHNPKLGAGVVGQVMDHLNGSYSAVFSLLWEGSAQVQVTLVHSSEAITVLDRLTFEQHDRVFFQSIFHSGNITETTTCNVCLRQTEQPVCNYTDLRTGEPWFCYKPKSLSCNARISHKMGGYKHTLKANEEKLFQRGVNLKVFIQPSGSASITVFPKKEGQPLLNNSIVKPGPSGYYYQGAWRALDGTTVEFSTPSEINQCLKGKVIHMYGDSTVRQFFEYLTRVLPDLKEFDLHSRRRVGPFIALDYVNNILMVFRVHGPPIRIENILISQLQYIANELDSVSGGPNTIVIFGIWAHFGSFPIEVYIWRLQNIRRAVVQLLSRAPDTLVIIRTGNPKNVGGPNQVLNNSDWHTVQRNKVLKAVFEGLNVHFVNAWEMVLAHHLPHNLHPQPPIIKNIVNVILSYICPKKAG